MTETKKLSPFAQRLADLKASQGEGGGNLLKRAQNLVSETREALFASRMFFDALGASDTVCIKDIANSEGCALVTATKKWHGYTWDHQVNILERVAPGIKVAEDALETFKVFSGNDLLATILNGIIKDVVRPSQRVYSAEQFDTFLAGLTMTGLAERMDTLLPHRRPLEWKNGFYAATNSEKSRQGWYFVTLAHRRVQRYENAQRDLIPRIQHLLDQTTFDSDPGQQFLSNLLAFNLKVGRIVIWDADSKTFEDQQEQKVGLLAVLLNRDEPGADFKLEGWVADKQLAIPQAYDLPRLNVSQKIDQGLDIVVNLNKDEKRLEKDEFDSIIRVQRLLRFWLGQEGKFRPTLIGHEKAPTVTAVQAPVAESPKDSAPAEVPPKPKRSSKKKS